MIWRVYILIGVGLLLTVTAPAKTVKLLPHKAAILQQEYTDPSTEKITPEYLHRLANLYRSSGEYNKAIGTFNKIIKDHPNYAKAGDCLYMTGFIYEVHLKNKSKAKEVYREFLKKYPGHKFSEAAKFSLQSIDQTDEAILEKMKSN